MRLPEVLETTYPAADRAVLSLHVSSGLRYFPGHFPGFALLPGFIQIDWAIHYGNALLSMPGQFAGMENIKFQAIVQPGDYLRLELTRSGDRLEFAYSGNDGQRHSGGRIVFRERG